MRRGDTSREVEIYKPKCNRPDSAGSAEAINNSKGKQSRIYDLHPQDLAYPHWSHSHRHSRW